MSSVKVGDLVTFYRRRRPGLGIVLKRRPKVEEILKQDIHKYLQELRKINDYRAKNNRMMKFYSLVAQRFGKTSEEMELAKAIMEYNGGWEQKYKNDFVYIRWIKKPSNYEVDSVYHQVSWWPTDWVKAVK